MILTMPQKSVSQMEMKLAGTCMRLLRGSLSSSSR